LFQKKKFAFVNVSSRRWNWLCTILQAQELFRQFRVPAI
jgi:hypothetical protein